MEKKNEAKEPYESPEIVKVKLVRDELAVTACKTQRVPGRRRGASGAPAAPSGANRPTDARRSPIPSSSSASASRRGRRIPVEGMIETTYRCNLRCVHCYVNEPVGDRADPGAGAVRSTG